MSGVASREAGISRSRHGRRAAAWLGGGCACVALWGAAPATAASSVAINASGAIGLISPAGTTLSFAGTLAGGGIGSGALLADLRPASGGYRGSATIVDGAGSLSGVVRIRARAQSSLIRLTLSLSVTGATGRFTGGRGTLTGSATVTAERGVGRLSLAGIIRGAAGRAPGAVSPRTVVVNGSVQGTEAAVDRHGVETLVGRVTGVTPGPAVAVLQARSTVRTINSTFTLFTAGATLTGQLDLRRGPPRGAVRTDTGTASVTGGAGALAGARTPAPTAVRGTRNLVSQLFSLRIRGRLVL